MIVPAIKAEKSGQETGRADSDKELVPENSSMPNVDQAKKSSKRPRTKAEKAAAIREKRAKAMKFSSDSSTAEVMNLTYPQFFVDNFLKSIAYIFSDNPTTIPYCPPVLGFTSLRVISTQEVGKEIGKNILFWWTTSYFPFIFFVIEFSSLFSESWTLESGSQSQQCFGKKPDHETSKERPSAYRRHLSKDAFGSIFATKEQKWGNI